MSAPATHFEDSTRNTPGSDALAVTGSPCATPVRPLVVRTAAFGETVLLIPLLDQLRARFGTKVDVISSGPWTRPLLENHSAIADLFILQSRNTPYWLSRSQQRLVRWLRDRPPGPVWYCDASGVVRQLLTRAGVREEYIADAQSLSSIAGEHLVERWIRFANASPPGFESTLPAARANVESRAILELPVSSSDVLNAWLAGRGLADKPLIAIQAGNKRTMRGLHHRRPTNTKYWPEERWAQVIRTLHTMHPDHAFVLLGVPAEYRQNAAIARLAGVPDVHNVADDLPISVLLPLLRRAAGMISVDTGPAHAAAALNCPTVVLFGAADPILYRPGGVTTPAIPLTGSVDGKPSIQGIDPQAVIDAWTAVHASAAALCKAS